MNDLYVIPNPCPKKWVEMEGNGRARLCGTCNTLVHNIEAYSEAEWEKLFRESGGHVCGMRGGESPRERRSRRAVLFGALLSAISPLMAQTGRLKMTIMDPAGGIIPNAEIQIIDAEGKALRSVKANDGGVIQWTSLPLGEVRFRAEVVGFERKVLVVPITGAEDQSVEMFLKVGTVGITILVDPKP